MLVLTRKPNQQLTIGKDIVITVVKVRGNTIRLGIDAPKDVRVIRSELDIRIDGQLTADIEPTEDSVEELASEGGSSKPSAFNKADADDVVPTAGLDSSETPRGYTAVSPQHLVKNPPAARSNTGSKQDMGRRNSPPLKAFQLARSFGNRNQQLRNLEDSPMCHRASLGQREQQQREQGRRESSHGEPGHCELDSANSTHPVSRAV